MIRIKQIRYFLLLVFSVTTISSCFLVCHRNIDLPSEVNSALPSNETLWYITECDSIKKNNFFGYQNIRFQTYTFSSKTLVYCSPMSYPSVVVDTIFVNTEVRGRRTINHSNILWLEIFHNGKTRYVKEMTLESKVIFSKEMIF